MILINTDHYLYLFRDNLRAAHWCVGTVNQWAKAREREWMTAPLECFNLCKCRPQIKGHNQ